MKKILFVLFQDFALIPDGGDQCNKRNLDAIYSICGENNVDIFYLRKSCRTNIMELCRFVFYLDAGYYRAVTPTIIKDIYKKAQNYECVFLSSSLFGKIAQTLRMLGYKGKIITQFHNVETSYYQAVLPKYLPFRKRIINCIAENERLACLFSDVRLALNRRDESALNSLTKYKIDFVIPITLKDKYKTTDSHSIVMTGKKPLVVFIGSNFPPNANGVLWFVDKVLPFVDINLLIVGKDMNILKEKHPNLKSIDVKSNVPNLAPYFEIADIVISPIFSGSGMKVKTCESLMYGKNIIGTNEAFEGYELDYDKVGKLANTAQEFIDYIQTICKNPIPRFNDYSRKIYLEKYSNESVVQKFQTILK